MQYVILSEFVIIFIIIIIEPYQDTSWIVKQH